MGYLMVYESYRQPKTAEKTFRLRSMIAACLLAFCFIVRTFWGPGAEILRETFLPVKPTVTQIALETLLADLQAGENIESAFLVFCESVLNEGY